jgi:hypothetical protein
LSQKMSSLSLDGKVNKLKIEIQISSNKSH